MKNKFNSEYAYLLLPISEIVINTRKKQADPKFHSYL